MVVNKPPESDAESLPSAAYDWLQLVLKQVELFYAETSGSLTETSDQTDCWLVTMRAVKLALLESGMNDEAIRNLFGQVAMESAPSLTDVVWTADLNQQRFELIDRDIQGTLSPAEQIELTGLTQLMRLHVNSEANLPMEGARKLHRFLLDSQSEESEEPEL